MAKKAKAAEKSVRYYLSMAIGMIEIHDYFTAYEQVDNVIKSLIIKGLVEIPMGASIWKRPATLYQYNGRVETGETDVRVSTRITGVNLQEHMPKD